MGAVTKVHEVQWRLLWERLRNSFRQTQWQKGQALPDGAPPEADAELLLRMAGATMTLLEWHTTDAKGRCRVRGCARRRWMPWRERRPCRVFLTVQFWMEQPLDMVEKTASEW